MSKEYQYLKGYHDGKSGRNSRQTIFDDIFGTGEGREYQEGLEAGRAERRAEED